MLPSLYHGTLYLVKKENNEGLTHFSVKQVAVVYRPLQSTPSVIQDDPEKDIQRAVRDRRHERNAFSPEKKKY